MLITDPVNIQYATGATNMSVFTARTPARYLLVFAAGPVILFDFFGGEHLAADLLTIDEVRGARALCFVSSNGFVVEQSQALAAEIAGLVHDQLGRLDRLAIDRFRFETADALRTAGFDLTDADPILSRARRIKQPIELSFMREAMHRVEAATTVFEDRLRPEIGRASCRERVCLAV